MSQPSYHSRNDREAATLTPNEWNSRPDNKIVVSTTEQNKKISGEISDVIELIEEPTIAPVPRMKKVDVNKVQAVVSAGPAAKQSQKRT